ncbi:hypothetical protein Fleli_0828 [Bernardetia litoralis DSM 6794]|uniref:Uncharacterized protein n=1 Tax=Bernardetia litoralis (strain ATCC 23117 / DSM 6794 / NBRC 15988 / NCIMB 1366 / Fx l1 / Sio-4) TaxID=880071 RepID=I4AH51_BERLS|nr:hypothetical protein [Bernardetia litoralis]AFM03286.1 hypothetical protein Fleli_0828 [Bernardetia litoralis DSM 6794]
MQHFKDEEAHSTAESYALQFQKFFGLAVELDTSDDKKVALLVDKSRMRGQYDIDSHVDRMNHYFKPLVKEGIEFEIIVL